MALSQKYYGLLLVQPTSKLLCFQWKDICLCALHPYGLWMHLANRVCWLNIRSQSCRSTGLSATIWPPPVPRENRMPRLVGKCTLEVAGHCQVISVYHKMVIHWKTYLSLLWLLADYQGRSKFAWAHSKNKIKFEKENPQPEKYLIYKATIWQ